MSDKQIHITEEVGTALANLISAITGTKIGNKVALDVAIKEIAATLAAGSKVQLTDGTEDVNVNASNELQVRDDDANTTLTSIDGKVATQTTLAAVLAQLDVDLSTRATETTLASILAQLDVDLSTRATETTLASVLAQLDVDLSTRASETTLQIITDAVENDSVKGHAIFRSPTESLISVTDTADTEITPVTNQIILRVVPRDDDLYAYSFVDSAITASNASDHDEFSKKRPLQLATNASVYIRKVSGSGGTNNVRVYQGTS